MGRTTVETAVPLLPMPDAPVPDGADTLAGADVTTAVVLATSLVLEAGAEVSAGVEEAGVWTG